MKRVLLLACLLSTAIYFDACKKSDSTPANTALMMFVHGCAAGATTINVDGRVSGTTVSGASNISFLHYSPYLAVTPGTGVALSFFVTGLNQLTSNTATLTANAHYSAFAGGSITAPVFVLATDDLSAPSSGKAKVRFVNLSPDNLTTSCYVGTTKVDSNVAYMTCTPFFEVTAATAKVSMIDQVVLSNSGQINSQVLTAGKLYTFMFTGSASGSGSSVLTLTAIGNN